MKPSRGSTRAIRVQKNRVRTARVSGRRGLHEFLQVYNGLSGFDASTLGLTDYKTTYGEVSESGIKTLADKFSQVAPIQTFPAGQKTFYDLGCGVGKILLGIAFLHPEIQVRGIEIVPDRVRYGQLARSRVQSKQIADRVQILHGSFTDPNLNLNNACWIFISNLCLDDETQTALARKLESGCSKGCVVICSRDIPFSSTSPFEKIDGAIPIQMTWSNSSTCSMYRQVPG